MTGRQLTRTIIRPLKQTHLTDATGLEVPSTNCRGLQQCCHEKLTGMKRNWAATVFMNWTTARQTRRLEVAQRAHPEHAPHAGTGTLHQPWPDGLLAELGASQVLAHGLDPPLLGWSAARYSSIISGRRWMDSATHGGAQRHCDRSCSTANNGLRKRLETTVGDWPRRQLRLCAAIRVVYKDRPQAVTQPVGDDRIRGDWTDTMNCRVRVKRPFQNQAGLLANRLDGPTLAFSAHASSSALFYLMINVD